MRYTYHGSDVPRFVPVAFWEGVEDASHTWRYSQLYRRPWWKRALYTMGWLLRRPF